MLKNIYPMPIIYVMCLFSKFAFHMVVVFQRDECIWGKNSAQNIILFQFYKPLLQINLVTQMKRMKG